MDGKQQDLDPYELALKDIAEEMERAHSEPLHMSCPWCGRGSYRCIVVVEDPAEEGGIVSAMSTPATVGEIYDDRGCLYAHTIYVCYKCKECWT